MPDESKPAPAVPGKPAVAPAAPAAPPAQADEAKAAPLQKVQVVAQAVHHKNRYALKNQVIEVTAEERVAMGEMVRDYVPAPSRQARVKANADQLSADLAKAKEAKK